MTKGIEEFTGEDKAAVDAFEKYISELEDEAVKANYAIVKEWVAAWAVENYIKGQELEAVAAESKRQTALHAQAAIESVEALMANLNSALERLDSTASITYQDNLPSIPPAIDVTKI